MKYIYTAIILQQSQCIFIIFILIRITVGYGDIVPVNTNEMILCILTMLIACGVFGYSLNIIG